MRICLATIHAKPVFLPLALMYLQASLVERVGCPIEDVCVLELDRAVDLDELAERILATDPQVVGLSCYVWNVTALHAIGRRLRARRPSLKIVLGGPEVGPVASSVLTANPYVDVIVRSEGEIPFAAMIEAWRHNTPLSEVAGIAYRFDGGVLETDEAAVVRDLSALPSPHQDQFAPFTGRSVSIETQRGCVFRCNFCFYNKDLSIRNRRFPLDRVKREILYWLDREVQSLYLMDPVFNLNLPRAKEICRFLAERNRRRVRVHAEIWAEFVDDELAALMSAAGMSYLEVGLQTTNENVLASVERRLRMTPFLAGLQHLKRHGLRYELQLIYGLPGETPESFREALDFAAALDPPRLSVFMLMVLPGTELSRKAREFGLVFDPDPPYYVRSHPTMTERHIEEGMDLIRANRLFRRSATMRLLRRWPGQTLSQVLDAWVQGRTGRNSSAPTHDAVLEFLRTFSDRAGIPRPFVAPLLERDLASGFDLDADWRMSSEDAGVLPY